MQNEAVVSEAVLLLLSVFQENAKSVNILNMNSSEFVSVFLLLLLLI